MTGGGKRTAIKRAKNFKGLKCGLDGCEGAARGANRSSKKGVKKKKIKHHANGSKTDQVC